jgi:hypothetical protein
MKLIFSLVVALFFRDVPGPVPESWVIQKNSNLRIDGKTNINSFRCEIVEYLKPDTIYFFREENNRKPIAIRGGLEIEIKRFDCHQKYITSDMRKTLRAEDQPILKIDLLTIGCFNGNGDNIKGLVNIWLAGVVKTMEIDYQVQATDPGYLQLTGTRRILFSDFGLKAPQRLAGLIKVEEELNVRFQLILRNTNTNHQIIVNKKD